MIKLNDKVTLKSPAIDNRAYTVVNLFKDYEVEEEGEGEEAALIEFADIRQNASDKPYFVRVSELQQA